MHPHWGRELSPLLYLPHMMSVSLNPELDILLLSSLFFSYAGGSDVRSRTGDGDSAVFAKIRASSLPILVDEAIGRRDQRCRRRAQCGETNDKIFFDSHSCLCRVGAEESVTVST